MADYVKFMKDGVEKNYQILQSEDDALFFQKEVFGEYGRGFIEKQNKLKKYKYRSTGSIMRVNDYIGRDFIKINHFLRTQGENDCDLISQDDTLPIEFRVNRIRELILILIPNIIYAVRVKDVQNLCTNKFMNILEQIGRYGSMFLMVFNIGLAEFGFGSVEAFLIYLMGNIVIILAYWLIWILYFRKRTFGRALALAVLPTGLFILCGLTLRHYLLVGTALIFGVGHIYVTVKGFKR